MRVAVRAGRRKGSGEIRQRHALRREGGVDLRLPSEEDLVGAGQIRRGSGQRHAGDERRGEIAHVLDVGDEAARFFSRRASERPQEIAAGNVAGEGAVAPVDERPIQPEPRLDDEIGKIDEYAEFDQRPENLAGRTEGVPRAMRDGDRRIGDRLEMEPGEEVRAALVGKPPLGGRCRAGLQ
jgi:hypothetical protein